MLSRQDITGFIAGFVEEEEEDVSYALNHILRKIIPLFEMGVTPDSATFSAPVRPRKPRLLHLPKLRPRMDSWLPPFLVKGKHDVLTD